MDSKFKTWEGREAITFHADTLRSRIYHNDFDLAFFQYENNPAQPGHEDKKMVISRSPKRFERIFLISQFYRLGFLFEVRIRRPLMDMRQRKHFKNQIESNEQNSTT